ncbi:MAG: flippase [Candidatus Nanoarchaeia archaeon]|nr:flippase [Candidatus Nanoarchaeia archaeon]
MKNEGLRKISEGALIVLVGIVLSKLLGYVYRFIVARTGTETYGMISTGLAAFSILSTIALLGLDYAVTRYVSFYNQKAKSERLTSTIKSALGITTITSIILGVVLFVFSDQIAVSLFHVPALSNVLKIFSFAIPLASIRNIFLAAARGFKKIEYEVYSKNLLENISRIIFTIIAIIIGSNLIGISVAYVLGILISLILSFYLSEKLISIIREKSNISMSKELLTYSIPLTVSTIFILFTMWIDTLMIGFFRTMSEVGVYNAVMPLSQMMHIFTMALVSLFLPVITEFYARDQTNEIGKTYKVMLKWTAMVNIFFLFLFIFFPSQILTILFGQSYAIGKTALIIISLGYFIYSFSLVSFQVLITFKKTLPIMYISIITTLINVVLNYFLIPKMGIDGAAISTSVSFVIFTVIIFIYSIKLTESNPLDPRLLNVFASATITFILLLLTRKMFYMSNKIPYIIILTIIFGLIYLVCLLLTKSFSREDVFVIKDIQQKTRINFNPVNNLLRRFI